MTMIEIPNNWRPRAYQRPAWDYLERGGRRSCLIWHRRSGKDDLCMHWTAVAALSQPAMYWHLLPEAKQARKALWDAVNPKTGKRRIDEAFPPEIRSKTRENEMQIVFVNGSVWQVLGSDNFNSLIGSPPYGIVFSEYALSNPSAWAYLRPIIRENGGWVIFNSTPRGKNHAYTMLQSCREDERYFGQLLGARETSVFSADALDEERREYVKENGEDEGNALFDQEYLCSFEPAIVGAYYTAEMRQAETQGRITRIPYEPLLPVHTAWDLGIDDATVIWFFQMLTSGEIRIIDYLAGSHGLTHWVKELDRLTRERGYKYGRHIGPHDIAVREWGSGRTRLETAQKLEVHFEVAPNISIADGINAVRTLIPRMWFDAERCADGISALRSYRKQWDDARKTFSKEPLHDWASHPADAMRYLAVGCNRVEASSKWGKKLNYRGVPA